MTDLFGVGGRELLERLALPPTSAGRVAANLRLIDGLEREVAAAGVEIARTFRGDPRIERLLPIPGIGPLTAATILAEIGDASRFPDPEHLCSWAGLTPTERSSAEHTRRGHISKQGSRWLRWVMVESATHAADEPGLHGFFSRICHPLLGGLLDERSSARLASGSHPTASGGLRHAHARVPAGAAVGGWPHRTAALRPTSPRVNR